MSFVAPAGWLEMRSLNVPCVPFSSVPDRALKKRRSPAEHRRRLYSILSRCTPRASHTPPKPGEVREMTIKQLGNFDYDPMQDMATIPKDVRKLSGMTVRLQ